MRNRFRLARGSLSGLLILVGSMAFGFQVCRGAEPPTAISVSTKPTAVAVFRTQLAEIVAQSEQKMQAVVAGAGGWLFFVPEARSLSMGPFWGVDAQSVSRAANPKFADPLPAIVAFQRELQGLGVELLVVPVPAKLSIYPEALVAQKEVPAQEKLPGKTTTARLDSTQLAFIELLRKHGVDVLDLVPVLMEQRQDPAGLVFCKTDSHWSSRGSLLAARAIATHLQDRGWLKSIPRLRCSSEIKSQEIRGDLALLLNPQDPIREQLPLTHVTQIGAPEQQAIAIQRDSPVLLMGDSHTLVFHDPELHAQGAGLPDHLALELGFAVDLIGVRGSGSTATRISLLRRGDNLRGKKLVIWCFASREFTESTDGWRIVPLTRKPK